jgi:hypothetical protein
VIGRVADATSIQFVFAPCSYLPVLGFAAVLLPHIETRSGGRRLEPPPIVDAAEAGGG